MVVQKCKNSPFSLACDESNDRNCDKTLVVLVRYFSEKAKTRFLAMPVCNIGTSENIFRHLQQIFLDNGIPWKNLVSFVSDNCNVMMGSKNSVMTRIKYKVPTVFDMGCVCHLANLCTVVGVKSLSLPAEELLVDVYFHLYHSSTRKEAYKKLLEFCDIEPSTILKHCSTRWLSLEKCVKRLLEHWPALASYFQSHNDVEKPGRIKRVADMLVNKEMHLYYHFLAFILEPLNEFNTTFQADESRIGYLGDEMKWLLCKFLGKFFKAKILQQTDDLTNVLYDDRKNQLCDEIIAVGTRTRLFLAENQDDISPSTLSRFFQGVRLFYMAVVKKMITKFPFKDPVGKCFGVLNPDRRGDVPVTSVIDIANRFPGLIDGSDMSKLEDQYNDFACILAIDLPVYEKGKTSVDIFWGEMATKTNKVTGTTRFDVLCKVAHAMCTIPNTNADCEQVFSIVRKVQTEQRSSLDNETLQALLSSKINTDDTCFSYKPSRDILKLAKSATYSYNNEHKG